MTTTVDAPAADVDTSAFAARANPVAKLAVGLVVAIALILSLDVVTAGTALALELLALTWCGVRPRALWRRGRLLLVTPAAAGLGTALFGVSGAVAGAAVALRILAVALPGVVLVATTDATDLAEALAQVSRLPHRCVRAALAATRLLGVLADEWAVLGLARRARGLGDGGPVGRLRDHLGRVVALVVVAVRPAP